MGSSKSFPEIRSRRVTPQTVRVSTTPPVSVQSARSTANTTAASGASPKQLAARVSVVAPRDPAAIEYHVLSLANAIDRDEIRDLNRSLQKYQGHPVRFTMSPPQRIGSPVVEGTFYLIRRDSFVPFSGVASYNIDFATETGPSPAMNLSTTRPDDKGRSVRVEIFNEGHVFKKKN